jgi:hypothetical protein
MIMMLLIIMMLFVIMMLMMFCLSNLLCLWNLVHLTRYDIHVLMVVLLLNERDSMMVMVPTSEFGGFYDSGEDDEC